MNPFEGVIAGSESFHPDEGIVMHDREEIFAFQSENGIEFSQTRCQDPVAGLFYDQSSGLYGIEPAENRAVFLVSGQPLGKDRQYFVERGTEIYFLERKNTVRLG